ncbi:MAG: hypothetical protein U0Q19_22250 [Kineosporiaceae bacterium]
MWTQWSAAFQPGGEAISRLFGRRVQQLALPTRPLDVAHGMDSRVVHLLGDGGRQLAAGWLRTLAATGEFVYSGCYSVRRLPGGDQPSVHVAFPLERGNVQVFLRPAVSDHGSLVLSSPPGDFGTDGACVVVGTDELAHAARVPLHERFHVYRDRRGAASCAPIMSCSCTGSRCCACTTASVAPEAQADRRPRPGGARSTHHPEPAHAPQALPDAPQVPRFGGTCGASSVTCGA